MNRNHQIRGVLQIYDFFARAIRAVLRALAPSLGIVAILELRSKVSPRGVVRQVRVVPFDDGIKPIRYGLSPASAL